ncbi:ACP S-malonyltransferase [Thiosulfativibrio zosterae]|uniref:Malonyl CoA-acyl carrier protein transacylase n=1 Tax=Thiosulfativibrio zosterae TaxID=2675053 RepID=A0A6F8PNW5_9GAMM|nr:ACP S-malonyltransferase [Thiosulfativibrio zosterae]BBP43812.1 malonyl CoA-acyl carrier protein transacylase [Thiosulfativibrio zosterae]
MSYAFVFPGQGSQSVGMLAELAAEYPLVTDIFARASAVLGYDLWDVVQNGPEETLNKTDVTQPAMLTAGYAVYQVLLSQKAVAPAFMAGHSLGEYTALVASGALTLEQGVELVAERGRLMQSAVPAGTGAMAAVLGLEDAQVVTVCAEVDGVVEAVNFNSPGQVVIAGTKDAVDEAIPKMEAAGASRVVPLAVSVPSHCSLMKPAADALAIKLSTMDFNLPTVPVLHNVAVESYQDVAQIKQALVAQLYQPVQWVKTVQTMQAQGVTDLYELGPGKVLMGLNRRIDRKMGMKPVLDVASLNAALETL